MARLPPTRHNSETTQGALAHQRERLKKGAPSLASTLATIFIVPPLAVYWLIQWLYRQITGKPLPGPVVRIAATGDQAANCAGSRRVSGSGLLARCSQCGKYVGVKNGRLLVHSR
jgi:hypothetical protein